MYGRAGRPCCRSIRYARTVSRTSVMSRRVSRFPTLRTGSRSPASISAICRAKLDVTYAGDCRGPAWLNGLTTKTGAWTARNASISWASLLTPYGSEGPIGIVFHDRPGRVAIDERGAGHEHGALESGGPHAFQHMVRAEHVHAQRALGLGPRLADVGDARAVVDGGGTQVGERPRHGLAIEQIDRRPAHARVVDGGARGRRGCDHAATVGSIASSSSTRWLPANPVAPVTSGGPGTAGCQARRSP